MLEVINDAGAGLDQPDQQSEEISVLLVEDHALVRRGFRRLLEDDPVIRIVGEASTGEEAICLAEELQPAVVIMDCALPGINGLVATGRIREVSPKTTVLMLSMHSEDTWVRKAIKFGASGYILKNAADLDLAAAVRQYSTLDWHGLRF
jgi:DNA-binding NarL/FixJ family response regulator